MDIMKGFLGQFITAAELIGTEPTWTIQKVTLEKVESMNAQGDGEGGKIKDKIIVYFKERTDGRGWLVNRTGAECLKEMWGRETNAYLGKRITFHVQQVRVGPKVEPGIRIKGSPDLKKPHSFQLKLPRKKPVSYTLLPTFETPAQPASQVDAETGEIAPDAPAPTSDLLPRIAACRTEQEVVALKAEIARLPKGSEERRVAVATAEAMIEEFKVV